MNYLQKTVAIINQDPARKLLAVLIAIDLVFVGVFLFYGAMHVLQGWQRIPPLAWNLAADHSGPELFGYVKLAMTSMMLLIVFMRSNVPLFASWAFVFGMMLMDDMFQWHENGGAWLVEYLGIQGWNGIRAQDFGELLFWAGLGSSYLTVLAYGMLRSSWVDYIYSFFFFAVAAGLVFCGVVLDVIGAAEFLHTADNSSLLLKFTAGILVIAEDGGELIFMSIGLAGAYGCMMDFIGSEDNQRVVSVSSFR